MVVIKMVELHKIRIVVIISANTEWRVILNIFSDMKLHPSPFGQWFVIDLDVEGHTEKIVFFHSGWGKIAAASSTQYVIDHWSPELIINLGTCGGFEGEIEKGTIILVKRAIVYDIIEQMQDNKTAIDHYTTDINLTWLGENYPQKVYCTTLVSGDRDLLSDDIPQLKSQFGAVAGDWESGAIAWVSARNNTKCLILRGVTDLVSSSGGEAYEGNIQVYRENAAKVLKELVRYLPAWVGRFYEKR
jgi:adenosylhomocysteine nucleosidase